MNKTDFIAELCKKTGLSTEDGSKVKDIIGGGIMDKIKNPFGGQ